MVIILNYHEKDLSNEVLERCHGVCRMLHPKEGEKFTVIKNEGFPERVNTVWELEKFDDCFSEHDTLQQKHDRMVREAL